MQHHIRDTYIVETPEQATALLNPLRAEILSSLIEPGSAAEVARMINETPQRVNYHLKSLEKVGLAERVGTRQVRNLVEVLYQAVARTFVLSESLGWSEEAVQKAKDHGSLAHLITTSERIKKDALLLMERSERNEAIPTATLDTHVHLQDEETRNRFIREYVFAVEQLVKKYASDRSSSEAYHVVLAVYPQVHGGGNESE